MQNDVRLRGQSSPDEHDATGENVPYAGECPEYDKSYEQPETQITTFGERILQIVDKHLDVPMSIVGTFFFLMAEAVNHITSHGVTLRAWMWLMWGV